MPNSNADAERTFSTFMDILTIKINRLSAERVDALVTKIIKLNALKSLLEHIDIYDDFPLKMTAENVHKPSVKRAKSARRF